MSRPRAVLDTNCSVSALLYSGRTALLRTAWENGLFVPVMCDEAMAELKETITDVEIISPGEFLGKLG